MLYAIACGNDASTQARKRLGFNARKYSYAIDIVNSNKMRNNMSDLQRYIQQRKLEDTVFAKDFEDGYESFKSEVLIPNEETLAAMEEARTNSDLKSFDIMNT